MSSTSGPCGPSPNRMSTAEDLVSESGGGVNRDSSCPATPSMARMNSANHSGAVASRSSPADPELVPEPSWLLMVRP